MKKTNILGTEYTVEYMNYEDCPLFKENSWTGFCDEYNKRIVICSIRTFPGEEDLNLKEAELFENKNLRHEIIHAYLNESGLSHDSHSVTCWAKNEEMVDWLAIQFPKIVQTYKELGILFKEEKENE